MNFVLFAFVAASILPGATPAPAELAEAGRWADAKFAGVLSPEIARPGSIEVLFNNDPVQPNARMGKPLRIAGKAYTRGLYCHAFSKLIVHLPGPGSRFEALAGVDSNEQTSGGRGSVVFSVALDQGTAWSSPQLREGMPGVGVSLDLQGATQLTLQVDDAGDGISCDQADWADARVALENGEVVWLGDLPLLQTQDAPYTGDPFFSFTYGGAPSREFLSRWRIERSTTADPGGAKTRHRVSYTDPETGLAVRCEGLRYADFPTVEWTIYFKNEGTVDTPILENIQPLDTVIPWRKGDPVLHSHTGDLCTADSYEPHSTPLASGEIKRIANTGGRPTQSAFPYFNFENQGQGILLAVSWAGQWAAEFSRDSDSGLSLKAGQEQTHFTLHPGEEVRTPLIVLQFYTGDRIHAQNVWRSWMLAHSLPRPGGTLPKTPLLLACSSHQFGEMIHANRENQIFFIDKYLERDFPLDYWWMDAGWYVNKTGWPNTGTWEVDTQRFPGGLRAITDHAHAKGLKTVVWFEPERVTAGTWLAENHPEWILGGGGGGLLNLGLPEARAWLTGHVDQLLTEQGIDLYRQDFNMDPLDYWRANDAGDRQGITEIRHVDAYHAYWDELQRRHPEMLIDSCASGGRRNDLETLRRAVPLLRSDYIMEPVGNQCHSYALALWYPFHGTGTSRTDAYSIQSVLAPNFIACWDMRDENLDYPRLRQLVAQWERYGKYYFGDYYPLTGYSLADDQWIGWQFHDPTLGEGMVQVFRRAESPYESVRLPLHGLDPKALYRVEDLESSRLSEVSGEALAGDGLPISLATRGSSTTLIYTSIMAN